MTSETRDRRFPWGLTWACGISLVLLCSLGAWQLHRLEWKQRMLADLRAGLAAPARPLDEVLRTRPPAAFAKVTAVCAGLERAPFVELFAVVDGDPGVRLISVCRTADRGGILIDRGFVPQDVRSRPPVDAQDPRPKAVRGLLRPGERRGALSPVDDPGAGRYYVRDVEVLARALKLNSPLPMILMAETSSNPDWSALRPIAPPPEIPNNHMAYALTWFGLAAALAGVYAALLRRRVST